MKKPTRKIPQWVLDLPLDERALIALREAVRNAIIEHRRLGQPVYVWRDGKVVELPPDEPLPEIPELMQGEDAAER